MPDETRNDEIANLAVLQAFSLIQTAVGHDEGLVILTETIGADTTLDLWLFYNGKAKKPFCVTNDAYASSLRERHFKNLTDAVSFYGEIRGAGSWRHYYEDHPGEEKADSPNGKD